MPTTTMRTRALPISKGEPWGVTLDDAPRDVVVCRDDAELAARVWAWRAGTESAESIRSDTMFSVESGDVLGTVGGPGSGCLALPMDLCEVRLSGDDPVPMVAHVIGRRRWWRGEAAAVMNAAWFGEWYLGPKAHPNDGAVDITVGSLSMRDRLAAQQRAPSGTHLPHPDLRTTRSKDWHHEFARPVEIAIDGVPHGRHRSVSVIVHTDAFVLVN